MLSTEYHFPTGTIFPTPSISLLCEAAELGGRTCVCTNIKARASHRATPSAARVLLPRLRLVTLTFVHMTSTPLTTVYKDSRKRQN